MKKLNFLMITLFAVSMASCGDNTEKEPAVMLKTDTEQLDFPESGGTQSITVQANRAFTATPQAEWCFAEKVVGAANNLKISVQQNLGATRTTDIILSAIGATDLKINIQQAQSAPLPPARTVSRVVSADGKKYLEVDGKPYFFSNVQAMGTSHIYDPSWGSATPKPLSWMENVFEKTNAAGYKTIAVMLNWRDIEPLAQGVYDWAVIDKYVDWCNKYGMRMEIIWYGHNTVGGVRLQGYLNAWYPQIPQYLQDHDKYWNNGDAGEGQGWGTIGDMHQPFLP
ncbi:MAG: hypothetical protein LBN71_06425, partial [Tannerella sp.]|nr:hypothetical protein [Tannerella sp.]